MPLFDSTGKLVLPTRSVTTTPGAAYQFDAIDQLQKTYNSPIEPMFRPQAGGTPIRHAGEYTRSR